MNKVAITLRLSLFIHIQENIEHYLLNMIVWNEVFAFLREEFIKMLELKTKEGL